VITPRVARLSIFPCKSFDGVAVDSAELTARGGLRHDRRFAVVDSAGRYVNGKTEPRVHGLRVTYDATLSVATFTNADTGERQTFRLAADGAALAAWLSPIFGRPVSLRRNDDGGFPDDELAPGPTIVSTATLSAVASWFPGLDVDSVRRRLRTNIEVDGVPAFWEDGLFGGADETVQFRIGDIELAGTNPCQRCVVPSRDPQTGEALPAFAKHVAARRAATLPVWAERARFNHFYRLAVNTRVLVAQAGRTLRVGDTVRLAGATATR
jgi:uncharacterized protein